MCSLSFSSIHTGLHASILLPKPHTLGICVHTWLVMLSHTVMSVVRAFHPLWCWVWLVPLWEMVSHLSRCELTIARINVVVWAMVGMVEVVNTVMACGARIYWGPNLRSGQPRTTYATTCRYGMACLLIRYAICCVSCSVEWEWHHTLWHTSWHAWTTWCKRGHLCGKP
jgi:hypothetical protein